VSAMATSSRWAFRPVMITVCPQEQTVIITGRNAHRELVAMADTVTDMQEVRHAFNNGLQARRGIDF